MLVFFSRHPGRILLSVLVSLFPLSATLFLCFNELPAMFSNRKCCRNETTFNGERMQLLWTIKKRHYPFTIKFEERSLGPIFTVLNYLPRALRYIAGGAALVLT